MIEIASVHGRFQPFHNGHLAYVHEALRRAMRVHVGLTRVGSDAGEMQDETNHRFSDDANPFSYFERSELIRAALEAEGIDLKRVTIGPFPIENINMLPTFWPVGLTCFTTTVDAWNDRKIDLLRSAGYTVEVIKEGAWEAETMASGQTIRRLLRDGDESWRTFVPKGSHDLISEFGRRLSQVT